MHRSKEKRGNLFITHQQADVQPVPGKQGLSTHIVIASENKYHNHECPSLLLSPLLFIAEYGAIQYGKSRSGVLAVFALSLLPISSQLTFGVVGWRCLDDAQELSNHQNTDVLSTPLQLQMQTTALLYGAMKKVKPIRGRLDTYVKRRCAVL